MMMPPPHMMNPQQQHSTPNNPGASTAANQAPQLSTVYMTPWGPQYTPTNHNQTAADGTTTVKDSDKPGGFVDLSIFGDSPLFIKHATKVCDSYSFVKKYIILKLCQLLYFRLIYALHSEIFASKKFHTVFSCMDFAP